MNIRSFSQTKKMIENRDLGLQDKEVESGKFEVIIKYLP